MILASLLHDVEIDWGWPQLCAEERAIARRHEALLQADRKAHTIESAEALLLAAAIDLPGRSIRARAVDDERTYGWQVVEGDVYDCEDFDETGMFPDELTADDFKAVGVTLVRTPVAFPDSMLKSIEQRGWNQDSSLSILVQGAWQLAADDVPAGFRSPAGPRRMQSIYLPVEMWAELHDRARAEERSVSYLVQRAVTAAYELPVE
ncbi:MAG TPA: hypothetical protein VIV11_10520 [Kofleriaceae bacterium]